MIPRSWARWPKPGANSPTWDRTLPYVGENLQSLATVLAQRIDATHAMLERRRKQAQLEEDITDAVAYSAKGGTGNMVKFASSLDNYIKSFPDDPALCEFKQTRDEQALWYDVEEWNRLVEEWKDDPAGAAPHDPKARAEQCGRFLPQHTGTPDAAEIALYQKYLEAIDHRGPGADSATAKIQRLLSDILVDNLWVLKVRESDTRFKSYYLDSQPGDEFCPHPASRRVRRQEAGHANRQGIDRLFRLVAPDQDRQ